MPPYLAIPYFHLSKLPSTTKVAVTGFSLSLVLAILFVGFAVFAERTDYKTKNVKANFRGDEYVAEKTGEKFDKMYGAHTQRSIYDIVHPHSFMMPVIYFILCHLMEMSLTPRAFRMTLYLLSLVTMLLVIFGPWIIWTNISLAWFLIPAVVGMLGSFIVMATVPVWQMWFGAPAAAKPAV